jgi:hypothetical protein
MVILEMRSHELFAWAGLKLCVILLIPASQIARIVGVNHQHLAKPFLLEYIVPFQSQRKEKQQSCYHAPNINQTSKSKANLSKHVAFLLPGIPNLFCLIPNIFSISGISFT